MEHLNIERTQNGFKVSVMGKPHQILIMLGVLAADICETYHINPADLACDLPGMIRMAVEREKGGKS